MRIERDNTVKKEKWYAVTDKGVIYGGSKEIVERKIARTGAKERTYSEIANPKILTQGEVDVEDELPF